MKRMEGAGKEAYRKTWLRHGVQPPLFGVSYADLYKLQKEIGADQALASQLWKTGNHDARVLATLVADPAVMTAKELDAWLANATNRIMNDAVACVAGRSPHAAKKAEAWRKAKGEWTSSAGWSVVAQLAAATEMVPDAQLEPLLAEIRDDIAAAPNYARHAMNGALIAIGGHRPALRAKAVATARAVGKVDVDHGGTSCQTPDAVGYIAKMAARATKRAPARKGRAATRSR